MSTNIPSVWSWFTFPFRFLAGARERLQVRGSEEISQWAKPFEQFNYSPQEFYKLVERNLETRKIPGAAAEWRAIHEGNILSPERLYLNIQRERLLFVLCAAPFGNAFFVSCRLLDYRSGANLFDYLVGVVLLLGVSFAVFTEYGLIPGLFALGLLVTLFWSLFRRAVTVGGEWLDEKIADVPIIGPIYESLFRPDTYYRRDTAEMFRQLTHNAVMQAVDEMTTEKGIRGLTEEERKPVVRNLYKR